MSINKKDFDTIEYLLRKGRKQLEIYQNPDIRNILNQWDAPCYSTDMFHAARMEEVWRLKGQNLGVGQ